MILNYGRQWLVTILILIPTANLQIPFPMFPMAPPMYPFPPPVPAPSPLAMPYGVPSMAFEIVEVKDKKLTTTTTTEKNERSEKTIGIAIPVAFPSPVQFAVPAYPPPSFCQTRPRPNNCPVCPPCSCSPCTPAFFSYCSPCHQKCKCRNANDAPVPQPLNPPVALTGPAFPMGIPMAPGYVIPVHRRRRHPRGSSDDDSDSSDSSGSCSSERNYRRRRMRRGRKPFHRRNSHFYRRSSNPDMYDNDFAKPVLSYISVDGDVKLEKALSNDEATELMDERRYSQNVQVVAEQDSDNMQKLKVISDIQGVVKIEPKGDKRMSAVLNIDKKNNIITNIEHTSDSSIDHRKRRVVLRSGIAQHMLGEGKKELVFKPPIDKKISNLSVSFQIT